LSISGIEVYTGEEGDFEEETEEEMIPSGPPARIELKNASMNQPYGGNYGADKAFQKDGRGIAIT